MLGRFIELDTYKQRKWRRSLRWLMRFGIVVRKYLP